MNLFNLTPQKTYALLAIVVGCAWYLWSQRAAILAAMEKMRPTLTASPAPVKAVELSDDHRELDAFKLLEARFVRMNCKAGQEALAEVGRHWFDCGDHSPQQVAGANLPQGVFTRSASSQEPSRESR